MFDVDDIAAAGINYFGQRNANSTNRQISREQMEFQERMSGTAHQREVKDLISAGLNPILSANAGASAPTGAGLPVQSETTAAVSSALEARRNSMEVKKMAQDLQTSKANQFSLIEDANLKRAQQIANKAQAALTTATTRNVREQWQGLHNESEVNKTPFGYGATFATRGLEVLGNMASTAKNTASIFQKPIGIGRSLPKHYGTFNKRTGEIHG